MILFTCMMKNVLFVWICFVQLLHLKDLFWPLWTLLAHSVIELLKSHMISRDSDKKYMYTRSRLGHYSTHTFTETLESEKRHAASLPVLAEGCGWKGWFGSETSHANLPLASIGQARKLILLTQFWGAPWESPPTLNPCRRAKSSNNSAPPSPSFWQIHPQTDIGRLLCPVQGPSG